MFRHRKREVQLGRSILLNLHGNRWNKSLSEGRFLWLCVWTFMAIEGHIVRGKVMARELTTPAQPPRPLNLLSTLSMLLC